MQEDCTMVCTQGMAVVCISVTTLILTLVIVCKVLELLMQKMFTVEWVQVLINSLVLFMRNVLKTS